MQGILLKKKFQILSLFVCVFVLLGTTVVFAAPVSEGDYDIHEEGNDTSPCLFAKSVTITRGELAACPGKAEFTTLVVGRAGVVAAETNTHEYLGDITSITISQNDYKIILQLQNSPGVQTTYITFFFTGEQFSGLANRQLSIPLTLTGDTPTTRPTTKPTTGPTTPGSSIGSPGTSQNRGQTNPSIYDTISRIEKNDTSLEDEMLVAGISGAIISTESANQDSSHWGENLVHATVLSVNILVLVGFAMNIGGDILCIRRIKRKSLAG